MSKKTDISPAPDCISTKWDAVRETIKETFHAGRLMLRGQVTLGLLLRELKSEYNISPGRRANGDNRLTWPEVVEKETTLSVRSTYAFIQLAEACLVRLKNNPTIKEDRRQECLAIIRNGVTSVDSAGWARVDAVISSLTYGDTQASLLEALGIITKPKMPKNAGSKKESKEDLSAGQLALHFFEAVASQLITARTSPDYRKLLYALPAEPTAESPLSLAMLENELRAALADIEEVRSANARPVKALRVS